MHTGTNAALDELVADLFALDRRTEATEDLADNNCSGDCTNDGCSSPSKC